MITGDEKRFIDVGGCIVKNASTGESFRILPDSGHIAIHDSDGSLCVPLSEIKRLLIDNMTVAHTLYKK